MYVGQSENILRRMNNYLNNSYLRINLKKKIIKCFLEHS